MSGSTAEDESTVSPVISSLEPIAVFTHTHASQSSLRAWPPVWAERLHEGEMLPIKAFGSLAANVRSPRHIYFASWRDPDPTGYAEAEQGKPPTAILFNANFGIAPYEASPALVEMAEMFNRLDRAELRLDLVQDEDGSFRLKGLKVELNDPSPQCRQFRSCWKGEEIRTLDLSLQFSAPSTRRDPFRFHLSARLPRRYNLGAAIEDEHVEITASGGAMPLPRWINF